MKRFKDFLNYNISYIVICMLGILLIGGCIHDKICHNMLLNESTEFLRKQFKNENIIAKDIVFYNSYVRFKFEIRGFHDQIIDNDFRYSIDKEELLEKLKMFQIE